MRVEIVETCAVATTAPIRVTDQIDQMQDITESLRGVGGCPNTPSESIDTPHLGRRNVERRVFRVGARKPKAQAHSRDL